jgi:8-oxo-dGTP diphosphatase
VSRARKRRPSPRAAAADPAVRVAVDCVVFGLDDERGLEVLLIRRGLPPFLGRWALPGGFLRPTETLDEAALRELVEETGLSRVYLEQLYTFSEIERDPRGRVVSVAYYALVRPSDHAAQADTDASDVAWHPVAGLPSLPFDHRRIVEVALARLRGKVRYQPIGFELLPQRFSLSRLQRLYEAILDRPIDKRNFRKKLLGMGILVDTGEEESGTGHRAARLYRFDRRGYEELRKAGFNFEL